MLYSLNTLFDADLRHRMATLRARGVEMCAQVGKVGSGAMQSCTHQGLGETEPGWKCYLLPFFASKTVSISVSMFLHVTEHSEQLGYNRVVSLFSAPNLG